MSPGDHNDVVRESFRRQVGLFSGDDSPFAGRADAASWLAPLTDDLVALEVACGAAHLAEAAAPHVRQIVGIDLTPELLALGARRLDEGGIGNVLLQEGDAEALPFVDRSFDLVYCRASLHHMAHPDRAAAEMARVCRPGGRVLISDLLLPAGVERERFDDLHRLLDPSHVRTLRDDELAGLLPAGWTTIRATPTTLRLPLDVVVTALSDVDGMVAALRADLDGGAPTGFDPTDADGALVVSFTTCTIGATAPAAG